MEKEIQTEVQGKEHTFCSKTELLEGYADLLKDNQDPKVYFKKKKYSSYFDEYCQKQEEIFVHIKEYWAKLAASAGQEQPEKSNKEQEHSGESNTTENKPEKSDKEQEQLQESSTTEEQPEKNDTKLEQSETQQEFLTQLAHAIAAAAGREVEGLRGIRKGNRQSELNLFMVTSVFPCNLKLWPEQGEALCQKIVKEWKKVFPGTELGYADYEKLNEGFRSFWGFLTGR